MAAGPHGRVARLRAAPPGSAGFRTAGTPAIGPGGDIPVALKQWEPGQLEPGNQLVDRVAETGHRSQFADTGRADDPALRFASTGLDAEQWVLTSAPAPRSGDSGCSLGRSKAALVLDVSRGALLGRLAPVGVGVALVAILVAVMMVLRGSKS